MKSFIFTTHLVLRYIVLTAYSIDIMINNIHQSSFNCFSNLNVPAIPVLLPRQSGSGGEIFVQCWNTKFNRN